MKYVAVKRKKSHRMKVLLGLTVVGITGIALALKLKNGSETGLDVSDDDILGFTNISFDEIQKMFNSGELDPDFKWEEVIFIGSGVNMIEF